VDEGLMDALLAAGETLAEVLRAGLAARGLPGELSVRVEGSRVVVASRAPEVRAAELGAPGRPPSAPVETLARCAAGEIARTLRDVLGSARW